MQKSLDRYTINAKLTDRRYFECLFIITLSRKNIHIRGSWKSREAVEYATLEWVEWLNNRRILEPKEKNSPAKLEKLYYTELDITVTATGLTYFFSPMDPGLLNIFPAVAKGIFEQGWLPMNTKLTYNSVLLSITSLLDYTEMDILENVTTMGDVLPTFHCALKNSWDFQRKICSTLALLPCSMI